MLIVSLTKIVKPTNKEDKVITIAMCNLWYDAIVEPDEEVISLMKEYKVSIDDLHSIMIKMGISEKTLWKHQNQDLK